MTKKLSKKKALRGIEEQIKEIKRRFLVPNYDDFSTGWIIEDHLQVIDQIFTELHNENRI